MMCIHHFTVGLQKPMLSILKLNVSYKGLQVISANFVTKWILPMKFHFNSISVNNLQ